MKESLPPKNDPSDVSLLCSIVVVTSPVDSNPSTEVLDRCLASLVQVYPAMARCPMVVAADGCELLLSETRKKKRVFGKAEAATIANYNIFLETLDQRPWLTVDRPTPMVADCPAGSSQWLGFALTLKKAIESHVTTPFVFVTPHDYEFLLNAPVPSLPSLMQQLQRGQEDAPTGAAESRVHYIGFPNKRTCSFSKRHTAALSGLLPITMEEDVVLDPLVLWKENPHFASVAQYQDLIFSNRLHRFKRGHFIEDTLGQVMAQSLKDAPSDEERARIFRGYGTYLLRSSLPCTFHVDGRKYVDVETRQRINGEKSANKRYTLRPFEVDQAHLAMEFVSQMGQKNDRTESK